MAAIYLDNAVATRLDSRVAEVMSPLLEAHYASPESPHAAGRQSRRILDDARLEVARLIGCTSEEVLFVASSTEANNLALKGVCRARRGTEARLLISPLEHSSILYSARTLRSEGVAVEELPVDGRGHVREAALVASLHRKTTLVSVAHANPEVGTVQRLPTLARLVREAGALFHTDATLTAAWHSGIWESVGPDLLTLSPHLFHGPQGIAALVVRHGVRIRPEIEGGLEEGGLRGGMLLPALAAGFGVAARLARHESPERVRRLRDLGDLTLRKLQQSLTGWVLTGDPKERIPGHLSLCLKGVEGEAVVGLLDEAGIESGSGSACSREARKSSPALVAMGIDPITARGALEFCFGAFNAESDPERAVESLIGIVDRLRRLSPLWEEGSDVDRIRTDE